MLLTQFSKGAVAKGAVLSKIYDNFISRDEITRSKATVTLLEVTSQLKKSKIYKRLHLKKGDCDGRQYFWAATYLVKQVRLRASMLTFHEADLTSRVTCPEMDRKSQQKRVLKMHECVILKMTMILSFRKRY